jgi:hypothetical protein
MGSAKMTVFFGFLAFFYGGGDGVFDDDDALGDCDLVGVMIGCSVVYGGNVVVSELVTSMEPIMMVCFGDSCCEAIDLG